MKKEIKIISRLGTEFDSRVSIGKKKYLVQTEDSGINNPLITSRVYLNGQILLTRSTDYREIIDAPDREKRVAELMRRQHQFAIRMVKAEESGKAKTVADYLKEVKDLLTIKNKKSALRALKEALEQHPDDPFLLSYFGCLEAVVNKKHKYGIDTCRNAIETMKKKVPFGEEFFYPVFYLNLGRAYLSAGRKKEAIEAFNKGIEIDTGNKDLLWEMRKLGARRKPAIPFLKRSNPINKYMGMLLRTVKK